MKSYTHIELYPTEEYPDGYKLILKVGVQSFLISDGAGNVFENKEAAEWAKLQLDYALRNLAIEAIEEDKKHPF